MMSLAKNKINETIENRTLSADKVAYILSAFSN